MAERARIAPRVVNGTVTSPDVRLPAFVEASHYFVVCTITNVADLINPVKSASFFIEWLDEAAGVWRCGGGAHFLGSSDPLRPAPADIRMKTGRVAPDGTKREMFANKRVRFRATSPATDYDTGDPLFPETTGPVSVSLSLEDERAT